MPPLYFVKSKKETRISKNRIVKTEPVKEGDIVVLKEEGTTRALWKLAKVVETLKGREAKIVDHLGRLQFFVHTYIKSAGVTR